MQRRDRSTGRWSLALWLLLCWFLVLAVSGQATAQETPQPLRTSEISNSLKTNFQKLVTLVKEQKRELSIALEKQEILETALETSLLDLQKLTKLLRRSEETSIGLSQTFSAYKTMAEHQIRNARILALIALAVGITAAIIF